MKKLVPTLLSLALAGSLCLPVLAAPVAVDETASPSGYAIRSTAPIPKFGAA